MGILGIQQETLNAIATAIGIGVANFIVVLFVALRANRTRKEVSSIKRDMPNQVQSQLMEPLQKIDSQIAGYVQSGEFYRKQMEALIADQDKRHDRLLAELTRSTDQLRIFEQTNNDLKEFISEQFKERSREFDRRKELEACIASLQNEIKELRATNDTHQISQNAQGKQIERLQLDLAETRRELVKAQTNADDARKETDQQRTENVDLRQQLVAVRAENERLREQVETLMAQVASLQAQLDMRASEAMGQQAGQALADVMKAFTTAQQTEAIAGEVTG